MTTPKKVWVIGQETAKTEAELKKLQEANPDASVFEFNHLQDNIYLLQWEEKTGTQTIAKLEFGRLNIWGKLDDRQTYPQVMFEQMHGVDLIVKFLPLYLEHLSQRRPPRAFRIGTDADKISFVNRFGYPILRSVLADFEDVVLPAKSTAW